MKIVFDLDGTLICSKVRLYELFCALVGNRELSFDTYWNLKFDFNSNQDILKNHYDYSNELIDIFTEKWMSKIEDNDYLAMDNPIEGLSDFLLKMSEKNELYICTARQSKSQVQRQLAEFRILNYFESVFITEQKYSKLEILRNSKLTFTNEDWFVGDTGHDINTGKALGLQTCAVLSGFMSENALRAYSPDLIIQNVASLGVYL